MRHVFPDPVPWTDGELDEISGEHDVVPALEEERLHDYLAPLPLRWRAPSEDPPDEVHWRAP